MSHKQYLLHDLLGLGSKVLGFRDYTKHGKGPLITRLIWTVAHILLNTEYAGVYKVYCM